MFVIKFSKRIAGIGAKIKTKLRVKVDLETKTKPRIKTEYKFLANLFSPLKSANLDCINFDKAKSNAKFLRGFFLFAANLLA